MHTIQLAVSELEYQARLSEMLKNSGGWTSRHVETPDMAKQGVIVIDDGAFERMPAPLSHPERFVLITHNDPERLAKAWEAGIRSVVYYSDPASTAVLAILAAALRTPRPKTAGGLAGPSMAHGGTRETACRLAIGPERRSRPGPAQPRGPSLW